MNRPPKTLFLVTARSGSKGVPGKNVLQFGGKTALGLRIETILKADPQAEIVCSTDSTEYAAIARAAGAQAPFLRPPELASDGASSIDVLIHAVDWLKAHEGREFEDVVLIEPSSPFARPRDIQAGLRLMAAHSCPVVAVREAEVDPIFLAPLGPGGEFPDLGERLSARRDVRRQAFQKQYTPCGIFYGARIAELREAATFYTQRTRAFVVPEEYGLEIDSPMQAIFAKVLWDSGRIHLDE